MSNSEQEKKRAIKPELLGGFRDLLPQDALAFQKVVEKIRQVYESFGFVPLDTPCIENRTVLVGEGEFNKSIFIARIIRGLEDKSESGADWDQDYSLRFDLTVPLARVVSAYPDIPKPFKRYQIGKVWRGERPQAGRYREFYQFDFDTIDSNSILSDIETIQIMYETMKALGVNNFVISFNTRKVLNGLAEVIDCAKRANEVFRIIDKIDKIGIDGVCEELKRQPENQYDDTALALNPEKVELIKKFLSIKSEDPQEILDQLESFFSGKSALGTEGVGQLKSMVQALQKLNIPQENWKVDLSIARGLDYYTGPVFETRLTDLPELGSILAGGRFDGLTNRFIPGSNIAGVGASVGVDRLIVGMQKLGLLEKQESMTEVLVTLFSPELQEPSLKLSQELRQTGIRTEIYLGDDNTLRAQLTYAAKKMIPYVIIIGPDEIALGKVNLRDMTSRTQESLTKEECFTKLKAILKK